MIERVELVNFRSYPKARFEFGKGVTLIAGPNASGKTNLLEAVFMLCATKSFRAADTQLIHEGQDFYKISGQSGETDYQLTFEEKPTGNQKQVKKSGRKQTLTEYLGSLQAVLFEPNDLTLPSGSPDKRRRYLDYILCQTDKPYLKELIRYKKILKQRNRLLENFNIGSVKQQIFAWDVQLAEAALAVYNRRVALIAFFNEIADDLYAQIAGKGAGLNLEYLPTVTGDYGSEFMNALIANLTSDLAAGFTTIGPHREDFKIKFGEHNVTDVASRGELRTAVLVLKLAELAYTEEKSGTKPILLLDDVFSELDATRRSFLVKRLKGHQTLITTTEASLLSSEIKDYKLIETSGEKRGASKKRSNPSHSHLAPRKKVPSA